MEKFKVVITTERGIEKKIVEGFKTVVEIVKDRIFCCDTERIDVYCQNENDKRKWNLKQSFTQTWGN